MKAEQGQSLLPVPGYVQPDWRHSRFLCIPATYCFAIILVIVVCALTSNSINFSIGSWSRIGTEPEQLTYGLFSCIDGPSSVRGTSWSCLARTACHSSPLSGLCLTAKHAYAASSSFLGLELFAMTFALLLIERVLYMCFTQPYGWCGIVYCLASWIFILHLTAIAFWFGISQAQFDVSCDKPPKDDDKSWPVCAESGPIAATIGIGIGAIVGLSTCFLQFHRPPEVDKTSQPIGRTVICGKSAKMIALLLNCLMLGALGLMIASLGVLDWVTTSGSSGSLYALDSWSGLDRLGYDCIYVPACLETSQDGICHTFGALYHAGIAYTTCMIIAMVFYVFFMQCVVHYFFGFEFGVPKLNYLYGAVSGMAQTLGLIIWLAVSGASLTGDCSSAENTDPSKDPDVCLSYGSLIGLLSVIYYWVVYAFWAWAYAKRR